MWWDGYALFLFDLTEGIEDRVVFDANDNGLFGFAGDDANIFWVGDQREVATAVAAIKNSEITKKSTRSNNAV